MKSALLFIGIVLCLWATATQSLGQNLKGGLVLGINGTQVDGDANSGFRKVGATLGGYVRYPLNDRWVLRPEIRLDQLGSRDKNALIVDVGYFSFPLLLEREIPLIWGETERSFRLMAGPVVGALLYGRDLFGDRTADLSRFDTRILIGAGVPFSEKWDFEFRLAYSAFSFVKTNTPFANTFAQGRRQGAFHRYLTLGFSYHLGD